RQGRDDGDRRAVSTLARRRRPAAVGLLRRPQAARGLARIELLPVIPAERRPKPGIAGTFGCVSVRLLAWGKSPCVTVGAAILTTTRLIVESSGMVRGWVCACGLWRGRDQALCLCGGIASLAWP